MWLAAVALALSSLPSRGESPPSPERGRLLYENHCVLCHTPKVHRRIPPVPANRDELRLIVMAWAKGQETRWSPQDIEDVVEYLERNFYLQGARE